MRIWLRRLGWTLAALVTLMSAAAFWLLAWLYSAQPNLEGDLLVSAALSAPAELLRDSQGILTIRAANEADAAFALGYAHAQDRLEQLLLTRQIGQGRLAEAIGSSGIALDRLMRTLNLAGLAESAATTLSPQNLRVLQAYSAGINQYLAEPDAPFGPLITLVNLDPSPWRPVDSLLWGKLMALTLSGNGWQEEQTEALRGLLNRQELALMFPDLPPTSPVIQPKPADSAGKAATLLAARPPFLRSLGASNIFVVDGSRTASGKPLLANDPHLALEAPGNWYLARIETPAGVRAGATAPAIPGIVMGHNGRIAWGFTTTHSDTQDLVREKLADPGGLSYVTPSGPRRFDLRQTIIKVRGGADLSLTVRTGRFGPVISDLNPAQQAAGPGATTTGATVTTLAWPALRPDDGSANALLDLNRAQNWQDFRQALTQMVAPQQNIFFADTAGNIGFISPALVPLRQGYDGATPVDGWTRERIWRGFIPFADLPQAFNPPSGRLINANNRIVGPDYPYLLTTDWMPAYRARRIAQRLENRQNLRPADFEAIQNDSLSLAARDLLPLLRATPVTGTAQRRALALLSDWDGQMLRNLPQPLLFHAWMAALDRNLLQDKLGALYAANQGWSYDRWRALLTRPSSWCAPDKTCVNRLAPALTSALANLAARGLVLEDMAQWRWGDWHKARFSHRLLGRLPLVGGLTDKVVSSDGADDTVNRGTALWPLDPISGAPLARGYQHVHGASLRAVYDLADLDNSRFMIATGQSGNPLSRLAYRFTEAWKDGLYVKLVAPETDRRQRLRLIPR